MFMRLPTFLQAGSALLGVLVVALASQLYLAHRGNVRFAISSLAQAWSGIS